MDTHNTPQSPANTPPGTPITVTEAAAARIVEMLAKEGQSQAMFRITVEGGGCSGMQYKFSIDATSPTAQDIVIEKDNARVAVDDISVGFMTGSTLDYVTTLAGAEFVITNPNSTTRCGCGNSFSVI